MRETFKNMLSKVDLLKFLTVNTMLMAFLASMYVLLKQVIPVENKDAVMILIGMIAGSIKTIVDYYYGSSKGSSDKSEIISESFKKAEDENKTEKNI